MLDKLQVEITKTADGLADYVQIRSPAAFPVNIVLVAMKIELTDHRPTIAEGKTAKFGKAIPR